MLRYWTAGESHGKTLMALVDGFPAGVTIDTEPIDVELARRQGGYGRGGRQRIETDTVDILTGIWHNVTLGSPIALEVVNKDYKLERLDDLDRPRPGHGDLTGAMKYLGSIRGVLERASARETAVRVAAGALAKQLLAAVRHHGVRLRRRAGRRCGSSPAEAPLHRLREMRDASEVYSLNPDRDEAIKQLIDAAGKDGDTLGGIVEVARRGPALRPGHARPMGPQARRPAGPGRDGRAGDQGRRDRPGLRGGPPPRLAGPRPDPIRRVATRHAEPRLTSGRRTTPAGWRPA